MNNHLNKNYCFFNCLVAIYYYRYKCLNLRVCFMVFFTSEYTINVITTATNLPADLLSFWHIVLICLMPLSVLLLNYIPFLV